MLSAEEGLGDMGQCHVPIVMESAALGPEVCCTWPRSLGLIVQGRNLTGGRKTEKTMFRKGDAH